MTLGVWAQSSDDLTLPLPTISPSPSASSPSPAPTPSAGADPSLAATPEGDECDKLDLVCHATDAVSGVFTNTLADLGNAVLEAIGSATAAIGTAWVRIPTPNLSDGSSGGTGWPVPEGAEGDPATGSSSWGSEGIPELLGWLTWFAFGVAVLALIVWGARFAWSRSGDMDREMGRLGMILGGTVIIAAAVGIVAALLPTARSASTGSDTVEFLQNSLWYFVAGLAVMSVIIGGLRMAWEQRAQPGIDLVRGLLTLVLVSAAGVSAAGILVVASDGFANWILDRSLDCDMGNPETSQSCLGQNVAMIFAPLSATGVGVVLIIIGGFFGIALAFLQVILMLARGAMLVILTGILPLSASFTNTEMGRAWFKKNVSWLLAFSLYKPAVAVVWAVGFKLMGSNPSSDDDPFVAMAAGFVLLLLSIVALPALLRFVTPMVGAAGAVGGAAAGTAAAMALPSGAMAMGRMAGGGGSSGQDGAQGPSGASAAGSSSGSSGDAGGGSSGGSGGGSGGGSSGGSGGGGRGGGSSGGSSRGSTDSGADVDLTDSPSPVGGRSGGGQGGGGSPVPAGVGAGPSGGGAGSAAGDAAGGGATGGGATGGTTGGGAAGGVTGGAMAATGPVGVAMAAGAEAKDQAVGMAQSVADEATGEGGPDGSK